MNSSVAQSSSSFCLNFVIQDASWSVTEEDGQTKVLVILTYF